MNVIEQNDAGNMIAIAYQDRGQFFVQTIGQAGEDLDSLKVNDLLALDYDSVPIPGF